MIELKKRRGTPARSNGCRADEWEHRHGIIDRLCGEGISVRGGYVERKLPAPMMRALGAEVVLIDQLPALSRAGVSGGDLALVEEAPSGSQRNGSLPCRSISSGEQLAPIICTQPRDPGAGAGRSMPSVIMQVRAARLEAAPRRSRSMTLLFSATSWNLQKRRCWQAKQ